ncbi:MAG TPA: metalloregulator ArsR/SmtB family transcription factor [Candidatus Nanoarchaeia archaeon]|nr:metalloregulator ArsR/SmtB family transcription factor [Candidatus Nanoarchaeia archaeon]
MICKSYETFFRTLADKSKLEIINLLSKGPKRVNELSQGLGFEQSRVSHNLKALRERGFVSVKRQGKAMVYSLDKRYIVPILKLIDKHVDQYYRHYCKCRGVRWRQQA